MVIPQVRYGSIFFRSNNSVERDQYFMLLRVIRKVILAIFCLSALLLSCTALPHSVLAASDPITITSQTDTVHFPNYIDFDLHANDSSSPIVQAVIAITFNGPESGIQEDNHTLMIDRPAQNVTVHWREETTGDSFYPAGTSVAYYWQLEDSAGNWHTDVTQHFTTVDTRFHWQHLSQGNLQVNWYNRPQGFGKFVLNKASASLAHISGELGGGLLHPANLWIYQTDDDFHGSLQPNSYEWVGGEALPRLNEASIVVTDTSDTTLVRDMPHELTHLVFHQRVQVQIPTWFDEGLAVYNQLYHEPDMPARLQAALDAHALLRLNDIADNFPTNADQAYLAYAQSWNLVSYMYSTFGLSKMILFIKLLNNPQTTFSADLQQALGEDQDHLENQWRVHLNQPPRLVPDQLTPVATAQPQSQSSYPQTNAATGSPLLIALGFVLVLVSLIMLMLISVKVNRRKQQAVMAEPSKGLITANSLCWQSDGQPSSFTQPATYLQSDMTALQPFVPASAEADSWNLNYPDGEGEAESVDDGS
jgi:hypothetical protein